MATENTKYPYSFTIDDSNILNISNDKSTTNLNISGVDISSFFTDSNTDLTMKAITWNEKQLPIDIIRRPEILTIGTAFSEQTTAPEYTDQTAFEYDVERNSLHDVNKEIQYSYIKSDLISDLDSNKYLNIYSAVDDPISDDRVKYCNMVYRARMDIEGTLDSTAITVGSDIYYKIQSPTPVFKAVYPKDTVVKFFLRARNMNIDMIMVKTSTYNNEDYYIVECPTYITEKYKQFSESSSIYTTALPTRIYYSNNAESISANIEEYDREILENTQKI